MTKSLTIKYDTTDCYPKPIPLSIKYIIIYINYNSSFCLSLSIHFIVKRRILFIASFLALLSTVMHARFYGDNRNPLIARLDGIFRIVSQCTSLADGMESGLMIKSLGDNQFEPIAKHKLVEMVSEKYTWHKSTGRWGYTAELGSFTSTRHDSLHAIQEKTIQALDFWVYRRGAEPKILSDAAAEGPVMNLWCYNDAKKKTTIRLISRYSDSLKQTAVLLRVDAM